MMNLISLAGTGLVTGVGLTSPASCAAIHCAIDNFQETRFLAHGGDWIIGSEVPISPPVRGSQKLVEMACLAVYECLSSVDEPNPQSVPLLLCVSETNRPGRHANIDDSLLSEIISYSDFLDPERSEIFSNGKVGGIQAIEQASAMLYEERHPYVLVAGTDSLLTANTLAALDRDHRLLTPANSNGLIPGEAAAAVLLKACPNPEPGDFLIRGVGYGREEITVHSDGPFRADGMSVAIQEAMKATGCVYDDVDYRITDISGEQYGFKEAALASARTLKKVKEEYDIWHPADCIGDVGAAIVPCMLTLAMHAAEREFAAGDGVLFHCANDDEQRGVIIGRYIDPSS